MKTISNITQFLNQRINLKKFLVESGVHLSRINSLIEDESYRRTIGQGSTNSLIRSGEITYIITGDAFKAIIHTDKEYIRFSLVSLDIFE